MMSHSTVIAGVLPLLLAACATPPASAGEARTIAGDESFTLASGETVSLASRGTLRYVRLVEDSRCPPDVQCVWAGDAEVAFEWTVAGGEPEAFSLHTGMGDRSKDLGGSRLTLVDLARGANPDAQMRIEAIGQ